jgi:hypothetical protein
MYQYEECYIRGQAKEKQVGNYKGHVSKEKSSSDQGSF